ncbi:hypothetical protein [Pseudomonas sp. EMN2]|uniref:hypothetical protein n=1 Tax=Pseudomonas sp. EMN2 TaxID=2615212 RepID=UPI00129BF3E0|nr:hypothetical protein [Pseudomonas sp. EMN2]
MTYPAAQAVSPDKSEGQLTDICELYSKPEFGYMLNLIAMVLFDVEVDDVAKKFLAAAADRTLTDEAITALRQRVKNPVPPYDPLFNDYEDSIRTQEATVRMLDRIDRSIKLGFVPLQ